MTDKEPMQISEHELRGMTAELDEMHHATYPALESDLQDVGASARKTAGGLIAMAATRRHFLLGTGLAAGGLVLAACGGSSSKNGSTPKAGSSSTTTTNGDVAGLRTNASLENLAVFAYGAALTAAPKGKFGKVPDAVAGFAKHAMKQHSDHAKAFNAALTQAGEKAYTQPDPALASTIQTAFGKIDNVPDLLKLALQLEDTAAETYVKQMGQFTSSAALAAVATIAPVERQHAAILHFVLGQYPVPDTFVPLDLARPDSDAPAA